MLKGRAFYSSRCMKENGKALYFLLSAGSRRLKLSTVKRNSPFIPVRGTLFLTVLALKVSWQNEIKYPFHDEGFMEVAHSA